jgi:tripartite-type tricarboxylate transporter receptor subunit TctC
MSAARSRRRWRGVTGLLTTCLLLGTACSGAGAGASSGGEESPFAGETIHFVVSFEPGGGYDTIARAMAPYLEKELDATVVVENEDGAGGLLAANQVYAAEPDGLTVGFFAGQGIAGAKLGEASGARYDLLNYTYITRLAADPRVMTTSPKSDYKTIDDVLSASGIKYATAGTGAADNIDATVLMPVLGIDGRIVTGFESSEETALAVTKGEADIGSGSVSSKLAAIEEGEERPLLVIGTQRVDDMPDVPVLTDLDLDAMDMALAKAHTKLQELGRLVLAPPGVPEEERAALEQAFKDASNNPAFQKKMKKAFMTVTFTEGDETQQVAESVMDSPTAYRSLLEDAYRGQ